MIITTFSEDVQKIAYLRDNDKELLCRICDSVVKVSELEKHRNYVSPRFKNTQCERKKTQRSEERKAWTIKKRKRDGEYMNMLI